MLRLFSSIVYTIALCLFSHAVSSQSEIKVAKNKFGISLEFNHSIPSVEFESNLSSDDYELNGRFGFGLGVLYQRLLSEKFHLRVQPILSFTEMELTNRQNITLENNGKREAVLVELPINLVYEDVAKNVSPSFSAGAKYSHDFAANSRIRQQNPAFPLSQSKQLSIDVSAGILIQFDHFSFKPELVYSKGFLEQDDIPSLFPMEYNNFQFDQLALRLVFYGTSKKQS